MIKSECFLYFRTKNVTNTSGLLGQSLILTGCCPGPWHLYFLGPRLGLVTAASRHPSQQGEVTMVRGERSGIVIQGKSVKPEIGFYPPDVSWSLGRKTVVGCCPPQASDEFPAPEEGASVCSQWTQLGQCHRTSLHYNDGACAVHTLRGASAKNVCQSQKV